MKERIIPTMMFRDAEKAIEWLCSVFGFERNLVVPGEDGKIVHAQLICGDSMIMLSDGSGHNEDNYGHLNRTPNELEGLNTAGLYMYIEKIDAHYEKVKSAGAEIVLDNVDQEYGGRGFTCKDLEGHLWSFGSYNPWE